MRRETMKIVVIFGICAFLITLQEAYGNKSILPEGKIISNEHYVLTKEKRPYIVSIRISGRHIYTATIISATVILSTGDCASKVNEMYCKMDEDNNSIVEIYYGPITDGTPVLKVSVRRVELFFDYEFNDPSQTKKFFKHNYGLIHTGEAFDAKYAKEVRICDFNYGSYENMTVKITGWDSSISTKGVDDLPKVTAVKRISAYIWHNNFCKCIYKNKGYEFQFGHEYRCLTIQGGNQLTQADVGSPVAGLSALLNGIIVYVPADVGSLPYLMIYRSLYQNIKFPLVKLRP